MSDASSVVARRTHVALATLYVAAVVFLEVALFLRVTHLAFLLLLSNGFVWAVMAGLVVTLIYGVAQIEQTGAFEINPWAARTLLWMCVIALATSFLNAVRLVSLLFGTSTALTADLFVAVSEARPVSQTGLEALLRHHIHSDEWFVLLCIVGFMVMLVLLHIVAIVYFARASFPRLMNLRAAPFRPYNGQTSAAAAFEGVQLESDTRHADALAAPYTPPPAGYSMQQQQQQQAQNAAMDTPWKHSTGAARVITSRPMVGMPTGPGRPGHARGGSTGAGRFGTQRNGNNNNNQ